MTAGAVSCRWNGKVNVVGYGSGQGGGGCLISCRPLQRRICVIRFLLPVTIVHNQDIWYLCLLLMHQHMQYTLKENMYSASTLSSNCEYLSVSSRKYSAGGTFFDASFSAFTYTVQILSYYVLTTDSVSVKTKLLMSATYSRPNCILC